ncbi:MAG: hypothetical protein A3C56_06065 [Ignavibacteria bacterium RIFCSPHIGHO2_02_FULL_56_12]|nr:MAG: hypothetical protein A3C56_06065 [Ignavibacteria bacterium RIFCSPHIGHO2_02_FULL_56_12]
MSEKSVGTMTRLIAGFIIASFATSVELLTVESNESFDSSAFCRLAQDKFRVPRKRCAMN